MSSEPASWWVRQLLSSEVELSLVPRLLSELASWLALGLLSAAVAVLEEVSAAGAAPG